jgi:outer membrane usher protein
VPPGPFELTDVPVVTGAGDINLVVRDLLGRETIVRQSYYTSPRLLAPGLSDFSFESGWLRNGYGFSSDTYGAPFGAATLRQGLTARLTGEIRVELERARRAVGGEAATLLGSWGVGRASLAHSSGSAGSGWHSLLSVERSATTSGGALQWEQSSSGYAQLAQVEGETRPRQRLQASLSGQLAGPLTGGLNYTRQTSWNAEPVSLLSASLNMSLPARTHLSVYYSRPLNGAGDWRAGFALTRSLDSGVVATGGVQRGSDGHVASAVQASSIHPAGAGLGWRLGASDTDSRLLSGGLNLNTQSNEMAADFEASRNGELATRFGARGSLGLLAGMGFASRPVGRGSFAVVRVGEVKDVPVLRSHQVVTQTNGQGLAFVPGLLPYQANVLEIDPTELPFDAAVGNTRLEVTPYARSGVVVDFAVRRSRSALIEMVQRDGSAVPAGARVRRLDAGAFSYLVAKRGEVYMTELEPTNEMEVTWATGQCRLRVELPGSGETLPRIGPLPCLSEGQR